MWLFGQQPAAQISLRAMLDAGNVGFQLFQPVGVALG